MKHIYINKNSSDTLIMLHGTGGNEEQMLSLANLIDKDANILSIRGNVVENGMNRFFKRDGIGLYNIENYKFETNNLIDAINNFSKEYKFKLEYATIVGFSNGANIALGIIQTNPIINNFILYSPDYINKEEGFNNLEGKNIYISTAENDPYVNFRNMETLINRLTDNQANLKVLKTSGHQINNKVLENSIKWYKKIKLS